MPSTLTIGQRVAALREGLGLSQREFGEAAQVSQPTVGRWESDLTRPSVEDVINLAMGLDIPISTVAYELGLVDDGPPQSLYAVLDVKHKAGELMPRQKFPRLASKRSFKGTPLPGQTAARQDESTDFAGFHSRHLALAVKGSR